MHENANISDGRGIIPAMYALRTGNVKALNILKVNAAALDGNASKMPSLLIAV